MNMNKIYYKDEIPLEHREYKGEVNSFLWKFLYKRVLKKVNKDLINISNFKKIVFNMKNEEQIILENSKLPLILINKENKWLLDHEDVQYYLPLAISFCNNNIRYELVLIEGELEFRTIELSSLEFMNHRPILSYKNIKIIEESFLLLLEYISKK